MAAQVGALRVTVGADITGLKAGMARAQREVSRGASAMQKSVSTVTTSFRNLGAIAGVSLGLAGAGLAVRGLLSIADASKQLTAQLRLATNEYGSFAQANKDVQRIAETTRSGLSETANLYAVFQRNAKELGISQEQAARATETVNKTFQISGATAAEAAGGLRQFLQALQSGQLRGEEFNSVMENAPRLARLLADSLGVTIGQLRAMAKEGEITGDKLVAALTDRKFTEAIDEEFRQLPVTFGQAMEQIRNAAIITFGAFDDGGQFSTALANFITGGTKGFADLEQSAFRFGVETRGIIEGLFNVFDPMVEAGGTAFGILESRGKSAAEQIRAAFQDIFEDVDLVLSQLNKESPSLAGLSVADIFGVSKDRFSGINRRFGTNLGFENNVPSNLAGQFARGTERARQDATLRQIWSRTPRDILAEAGMLPKPPPFVAPPAKAQNRKGRAAPRDRSEDVEYQFEQEIRAARRDILTAQRSLAASAEARAKIELALLDLDKEQNNAALDEKVRKAERDVAEKKITASTLEEVKLHAEGLRAKFDEVDALKRQAVDEELLSELRAERLQIEEAGLDIQQQQLQSESALAETAAEQRAIQLQLLDLSYRMERVRLDAIMAEEAVGSAAWEEARMRRAALDARHATDRQGVINSTRGPMEDWLASLPTTAAKTQEAFERLQVQGFEGLIDAALALSEGFDSAADALLNTLKQFLLGLARMHMQQAIGGLLGGTNPLSFLGSALGGLGGGATGGTGNVDAFLSGTSGIGGYVPPKLAGGGSFMVKGLRGIDRNLLQLNGIPIANVSYGERIGVSPANDRGQMRARGNTVMNIYTPDADSFRRSEGQITREMRRKLA